MAAADTPFLQAVKAGDIAKATAILAEDPASVNARDAQGVMAVQIALYYRHPEIARLLVERGAELDLYAACAMGSLETVRRLLTEDPSRARSFSPDGFPAIGLAAFFARRDVAAALLEAGADVNAAARNPMKVAAIHAAAAAHDLATMTLLLDSGADPNQPQQEGYVPLHEAASEGDTAMVRLLVERGARVGARSAGGKSAEEMAREKGHADLADWLSERREPEGGG
jgi:ankyrin repeat protein